jgi:hypothetical protein
MNSTYEFVVLRLAPDVMRGELLNVGAVVFPPDGAPRVYLMAPLGKLRAIDATWNSSRLSAWRCTLERALKADRSISEHINTLAHLGYCKRGEPGMFYAENESQLDTEISNIRRTYVSPIGEQITSAKKERKTRLASELRLRFKNLNVLGKSVDDLSEHLIVQNVPVPDYPDLKADFVFKNGVYRITQTLDYRVSTQGAHAKINEACVKSMAAELASKTWGDDTLKLAVVQIPSEFADLADAHLDMLYAHGFKIFHADNQSEMGKYVVEALGGDFTGSLL